MSVLAVVYDGRREALTGSAINGTLNGRFGTGRLSPVGCVLPIATSRDSGGVCGLIEAVSGHDSMRLTQEDRSNSSWVCGSIRRRSREVTFSQKVVAEEEKRNAKTLIYAFGRRHSQFSRIFRERRRPVCKADIVRRESEIREPQSGGCQSFLSFRQWEIGIRCM